MSPFVQIARDPRVKLRPEDDDDERLQRPPTNRLNPKSEDESDEGLVDRRPTWSSQSHTDIDKSLDRSLALLDPDAFRRLSMSPFSHRGRGFSPDTRLREHDDMKSQSPYLEPKSLRLSTMSPFSASSRSSSVHPRGRSPTPRQRGWKAYISRSWDRFWAKNRGVVLVATAQLFSALMNLAARLLALEGDGMHPFQILFIRMLATSVISCTYMWWTKMPDFPLGAREVRWLLVARGFLGFFGIFGMWFSMIWLGLADATVITFLVPSVSGYICHVLLHDPFTRKEQIGSFIALAGVILIARPTSFFSSTPGVEPTPASPIDFPRNETHSYPHMGEEEVTPSQRLTAIGIALIGVLGGSGAFTTIRWIGTRAHPLISMNYFSTWVLFVSTSVLSLAPVLDIGQPHIRFGLPHNGRQWLLLAAIGVCGFTTQFLLTAGLGGGGSNRATAMVYTGMLFAAAFDKWVFGLEMGALSLVGCGLIIGSALWVALSKKETVLEDDRADIEVATQVAEAVPMLSEIEDGSDDEEYIPLEPVR